MRNEILLNYLTFLEMDKIFKLYSKGAEKFRSYFSSYSIGV